MRMCVYIYIYMCMYVYIYIYIYVEQVMTKRLRSKTEAIARPISLLTLSLLTLLDSNFPGNPLWT